jgi:peroxiredoxin
VALLYGGVAALPTTFIIDREGTIAAVPLGLVSKANYAREILRLLASDKQAHARMPGTD